MEASGGDKMTGTPLCCTKCGNELGTITEVNRNGKTVERIDPAGMAIIMAPNPTMTCNQCGKEFSRHYSTRKLQELLRQTGRECSLEELELPGKEVSAN